MDTLTPPVDEPDPIDLLIPPPRPWWMRLLVALVAVGAVGACSFLVGFGYLYPRPDCCGSGSGAADLVLAPDSESVIVHAYAFNSSSRDLTIESAEVDLPGARVVNVTLNDEAWNGAPNLGRGEALPAVWSGGGSGRISIEFVPESCDAPLGDWGSLTLRLDVVNAWLPSIDRTFDLPDPVVGEGNGGVIVWPPDDSTDWYAMDDPLEIACRLLEAAPS
jgi:hypothetical protein